MKTKKEKSHVGNKSLSEYKLHWEEVGQKVPDFIKAPSKAKHLVVNSYRKLLDFLLRRCPMDALVAAVERKKEGHRNADK